MITVESKPQMERMFTVEQINPYCLDISEITNVEDVGDEFYLEDEMREMLGIGERDWIQTGIVGLTTKVEARLAGYKQKLIESGKKTIVIEDQDLIDFFTSRSIEVSYYIPGLRRVGNRLSIFEKKKKVGANKRDFAQIIRRGIAVVGSVNYLTIEFKYLETHQFEHALKIIKSLITWEQLIAGYKGRWDCAAPLSGEMLEIARFVWDNPSHFVVKTG